MFEWLTQKPKFTKVHKMPTYIVTPGYDSLSIAASAQGDKWNKRRSSVRSVLHRRGFTDYEFVYGVSGPTPIAACAMSHAIAVSKALERKPFRPFLLLEDDVVDERQVSTLIEMPDDADAFYLGISTAGVDVNPSPEAPYIHKLNGTYASLPRDDENIDFLQVYNMLSAHAVIIASERFARNWLICVTECLSRQIPFDIFVALTHAYFNVYALKRPLFYQSAELGGQERHTRAILNCRGVIDRDSFLRLRKNSWPASNALNIAYNSYFRNDYPDC